MTLSDQYDGSVAPFEGDRTLPWRSLPANAVLTKATLQLTPVAGPDAAPFTEVINFAANGQGAFGATKVTGSNYVEIDFHRRRTLAKVRASNFQDPTSLQVDMGGIYLGINKTGGILAGGTDQPFALQTDGSLPGLTVGKFKLTSGATGTPDVTNATIRSVPTNVSARLGAMAPFWSRVGEMTQSEVSPDFSAVLQAYLTTAQVDNGYYTIPLVLHSDSLARLSANLEVEYQIKQTSATASVNEVAFVFDLSGYAKT